MPYRDPVKQRAAVRSYYLRNTERLLQRSRNYQRRRREFIGAQKVGKVCSHCGFDDPRALQFHHRDASQKDFTLAHAWKYSEERILAEIAKCDLICANCHQIEHMGQHD